MCPLIDAADYVFNTSTFYTRMQGTFEKPSRVGQWQEKGSMPVASRPQTKADMDEHRRLLVASYKCNDSDIFYEFQKISGENGDRDDCLWLKYKMKCVVNNVPTIRDIFGIKIPVPEEMRRRADALRETGMIVPSAPASARPRPQLNAGKRGVVPATRK